MKKVYRVISTILIAAIISSSLSVMAAPNVVEQTEEVLEASVETPAEPTPTDPTQDDTTPDIVDGIIQIDDEQELNKIGNDANYPLDGKYILTADITMTENFHPIGKEGAPFIGTFDGDGHAIYNLIIEEEGDNVGLFGVVSEGGIVKNIGVEDGIVKSSGSKVGGLVGWAAESTIENCYYTGKVSSDAVYVGGLIGCSGFTGAFTSISTISNCYHIGNVEGKDVVGGVVGYLVNAYESFIYESSMLENCYHAGKTYCNNGEYNGGVIGYFYNNYNREYNLKNCYYNIDWFDDTTENAVGNPNIDLSDNNIKGLTTDQMTGPKALDNMVGLEGDYIAALEQKDKLEDSIYYYPQLNKFIDKEIKLDEYNKLPDTKKKEYLSQFPYLIKSDIILIYTKEDLSKIGNGYPLSGNYTLMNDIELDENEKFETIGGDGYPFTGTFNGNGHTIYGLNVNTGDYAGLFGCVENGTVKNLRVEGTVKGDTYVGGVVGWLARNSYIENCAFIGNVSGKDEVGGITGRQGDLGTKYGATGGNAFIRSCCHIGTVSGNENVGGISGKVVNAYYDGKEGKDPVIKNCYHTGAIYGNKDYGGLIGYFYNSRIAETVYGSDCNLYYSYYDNQNCGVAKDKAIGGCTGKDANSYYTYATEGDHSEWNFMGLTTEEMTGHDAMACMKGLMIESNDKRALPPAYIAPPIQTDNSGNYYYPQLGIFITDANNPEQFPSWNSDMNRISIETADEFKSIGHSLQYPLNVEYILMNDIELDENEKFEPIGDDNDPFTGTFNGNGHTIYGLNVDTGDYAGLFGCVEEGTVKNVKIEGTVKGDTYVGGLVGWLARNSYIENCAFIGNVSGNDEVGGIAGRQGDLGTKYGATGGNAFIRKCYHVGSVSGKENVGGISGKVVNAYYDGKEGKDPEMGNCYHTGAIQYKDYGGGLIGYFYNSKITENDGKKTDCNLYNSFYDNQNCGAVGANLAIGGCTGKDTNSSYTDATKGDHGEWNFKGLTTSEMTGPNALNNMTGIEGYTAPTLHNMIIENEGNGYYVYYPQLTTFVKQANNISEFPSIFITVE